MDLKYQESTINRPEGDRVIDAPYVVADLKKFKNQLKKRMPGIKVTEIASPCINRKELPWFSLVLSEDADLVDNTVDRTLTIQVLDGTIECMIDEDTVKVKKNQLIALHEANAHFHPG